MWIVNFLHDRSKRSSGTSSGREHSEILLKQGRDDQKREEHCNMSSIALRWLNGAVSIESSNILRGFEIFIHYSINKRCKTKINRCAWRDLHRLSPTIQRLSWRSAAFETISRWPTWMKSFLLFYGQFCVFASVLKQELDGLVLSVFFGQVHRDSSICVRKENVSLCMIQIRW